MYKVLVIGDLGSGKTSVIRRYAHGIWSPYYKATIGVDFALKRLQWDDHTHVNLQMWDIAGQERFGNMTRVYYREAAGAVVVMDVTRESTLDGARKWKADLDAKVHLPAASEDAAPVPIPAILIANKIDLSPDGWFVKTPSELQALAHELGFIAAFETSAKSEHGIEEAFALLVKTMLEVVPMAPEEPDESSGAISLHDEKGKRKSDGESKKDECKC